MMMLFYNPPLFFAGVIISYAVLYIVVKTAVRNGIAEARAAEDVQIAGIKDGDSKGGINISQVVCKNCGKKHDMDYPKCPYCG